MLRRKNEGRVYWTENINWQEYLVEIKEMDITTTIDYEKHVPALNLSNLMNKEFELRNPEKKKKNRIKYSRQSQWLNVYQQTEIGRRRMRNQDLLSSPIAKQMNNYLKAFEYQFQLPKSATINSKELKSRPKKIFLELFTSFNKEPKW